jgi:hypothetical protein
MFLRVAKVQTFAGQRPSTNATGFFYLHDEFLYLITARHVVVNERLRHRPDRLQLTLHSDPADLRKRNDLSIPLYAAGVPQWYQHPRHGDTVDVVAVAINDPHVLREYFVTTFRDEDLLPSNQSLPLGQDVLILGFPLGFHDTLHNLPLVRKATVASSFAHPFKGEPYFLTDARLHRGMSGSPVFLRLSDRADITEPHASGWQLLGVHASSLDVSDRDPVQDERLALNSAWYASLIPEMLPARSAATRNAGTDADEMPAKVKLSGETAE